MLEMCISFTNTITESTSSATVTHSYFCCGTKQTNLKGSTSTFHPFNRNKFSLPTVRMKGSRGVIAVKSKLGGMKMGGEEPEVKKFEFTITQPDDWHLHLRDGHLLESVVVHSATTFGRAIIMPNLKPPITTVAAAIAYRERINNALPSNSNFTPLMTLYLTDNTSPDEIKLAKESGAIFGVKLYPAGATTNSEDGVTDLFGKCMPVLQEMMEYGLPLLVHGEVSDHNVDVFDREKVFIDTILKPLVDKLPHLKIVMEHITTIDAVKFVESCMEGQAIVSAVTSGSKQFFLGSDSAPHERHQKERTCGCAGIYSAPIALPLYAKAFEQAGSLDKLEAFTSFNGPDFYGLPRNTSKITLQKISWQVPDAYHFSFGTIVPMFSGQTLDWHVC